ncbi:hypothetical protein D6D21_09733 [Aureobasidium pullulans]|uniref:Uncharacterized protein n=1 Tax=Aureobasidium pullulans TaxID=5580 RepID=A0AB74IKN2_AURPU|nr:hypothetical protein D6D21_09733 [Aureobasidium pullulans]
MAFCEEQDTLLISLEPNRPLQGCCGKDKSSANYSVPDIKAAPPVLVGEDVAPAAVPEPDDDVVVMPAADELADEEPEAELDTLGDDPVDMADDTVVPDPPVVAVVAVAAARPGE